jgi:16S rRNA (adenine1518-N6/adenine1519-N6)-dimethyltransferase
VATEEAALLRLVDEAFAQRRKTMRNALRRLGMDAVDADAALIACGIDPTARPEQLGLEAFARITEAMVA